MDKHTNTHTHTYKNKLNNCFSDNVFYMTELIGKSIE